MEVLVRIFGEGRDLDALQMSCRGIAVFFIALGLIRVSGRRSFGLRMPLDNIITILLGAVLSRAIVGASAFVPVIICCFVIVSLHRLFCWLIVRNKAFSRIMEGDKILLYENGEFKADNLRQALVSDEDTMQGVRKSASTENMQHISQVYIERNGEISAIKKDQ